MAERVVERVRRWLDQGRTRLDAFQQLRDQGYGEAVAERIVETAADQKRGMSRKKLLAIAAVALIVIGGGAAFAIITVLPGSGGGGDGGETPVNDTGTNGTGNGGTAPSNLSAAAERAAQSTYQVSYTLSRGNVTPSINITAVTAYRSGGTARKTVTVRSGATTRTFSTYSPSSTSLTVLCGDIGPGPETCTTDHPYLYISLIPLTDLLAIEPAADEVTSQAGGRFLDRPCDRYTMNLTTDQLYAPVAGQTATNPTRSEPVTVEACLDRQDGYVADLVLRTAGGGTGDAFRMQAASRNASLPEAVFTEPRLVAIAADCSGSNATATLTALASSVANTTLSVDGTNRTVQLQDRYIPTEIPIGAGTGTRALTAYTDGETVSTTCTPS